MRPSSTLGQGRQSFANFPQRQNAEMEHPFIGGLEPLRNARFGPGADEFGNAIGIEQEATHSSISRPVSLSLSKSSSKPTRGDSRKNCSRLLGWRDRIAS